MDLRYPSNRYPNSWSFQDLPLFTREYLDFTFLPCLVLLYFNQLFFLCFFPENCFVHSSNPTLTDRQLANPSYNTMWVRWCNGSISTSLSVVVAIWVRLPAGLLASWRSVRVGFGELVDFGERIKEIRRQGLLYAASLII